MSGSGDNYGQNALFLTLLLPAVDSLAFTPHTNSQPWHDARRKVECHDQTSQAVHGGQPPVSASGSNSFLIHEIPDVFERYHLAPRCQQRHAAARAGTFFGLRRRRGEAAPRQSGYHLPRRAAFALSQFFGRLQHIVVDIQSRPHEPDAIASPPQSQIPFRLKRRRGARPNKSHQAKLKCQQRWSIENLKLGTQAHAPLLSQQCDSTPPSTR